MLLMKTFLNRISFKLNEFYIYGIYICLLCCQYAHKNISLSYLYKMKILYYTLIYILCSLPSQNANYCHYNSIYIKLFFHLFLFIYFAAAGVVFIFCSAIYYIVLILDFKTAETIEIYII